MASEIVVVWRALRAWCNGEVDGEAGRMRDVTYGRINNSAACGMWCSGVGWGLFGFTSRGVWSGAAMSFFTDYEPRI